MGTNTLYIGFGMNHPGGGLGGLDADAAEDKSGSSKGKVPAPSIVGVSLNYFIKLKSLLFLFLKKN